MKQILIVEDDSFLNKMVAYNLTADGYGVTSALNARTAAEAIRQREFDLVLLDINLPDGNGFELCKLIKPPAPGHHRNFSDRQRSGERPDTGL